MSGLKVCMVGEGTFPVSRGGVATWYEQLIAGLADHRFEIVTLVGDRVRAMPTVTQSNIASVRLVPMWGEPPRSRWLGRGRTLRVLADILDEIWTGVLPPTAELDIDLPRFHTGIRRLTELSDQPLAGLLAHRMSAEVLLRVWRRHVEARAGLPAPTMADAAATAHQVDRILALADQPLPPSNVIHLTANGPSAMMALAHKWRHGTPMVLTEHGVYLRERYLALGAIDLSWSARYATMALIRALCRLAYAEADRIAPVSFFNARWAADLGAEAKRIVPIHNGVDLASYPALDAEPAESTISWVGRIDPLKDLATLIRAFDLVRMDHPTAKLRLFGPVPPENREYHRDLVERIAQAGLTEAISFEGPVSSSSIAFRAGQVVALSSISEGLPFSVIEAMMSARPSVNTDVGGVAELIGTDGTAGLLVPPRDPEAMAAALSGLLSDHETRSRMGTAARLRAVEHFTLDGCLQQYRDLYTEALTTAAVTEVSPPTDPDAEHRDPVIAAVVQEGR